jgi:hypothetical protein
MANLRFRHHNNRPRCPVIGADDVPGEEYYDILARFSVRVARELASKHDLIRVEPIVLVHYVQPL